MRVSCPNNAYNGRLCDDDNQPTDYTLVMLACVESCAQRGLFVAFKQSSFFFPSEEFVCKANLEEMRDELLDQARLWMGEDDE